MKKIVGFVFALAVLTLGGCGNSEEATPHHPQTEQSEMMQTSEEVLDIVPIVDEVEESEDTTESQIEEIPSMIFAEGNTLETRIAVPKDYERVSATEESLTAFLRAYPMKEDKSPVLLYDGREKGNQSAHAAVFSLPIEEYDLQQCADSIMRMYAEYYWHTGQTEKIAFHFTSGFLCDYSRWREGYRVKISGNDVSWSKTASYDDSYETFVKYLKMVFSYAGTLSMEGLETEIISKAEMTVGDVLIKGGSPGHVVMVVDVCENAEGKKAYLLAQGYMPAQEFHVLNNPIHEEDPWYYDEEMTFPLRTAEYTFSEESMVRRLKY